ncbi:GNAT family N-acetyltransferase [Alphaproteobacteria bacterium GH1-50]|uniref:GNAT family N-acetyltransferase n=1 Tax=Kangsaoukella pontilimi TaxID=2691042 RepID=A0A7C9IQN7_9RHOB|nr:GNAT family N-acetyltransferase [Kangsaoukella pontilimi]MXQ06486.1 GNAT family N-acetyltransferase [Kangsaoukella pontilimi]
MSADTLTVRTARPDDLAALDALFARSYPALLKADYPASVLVTAVPVISRANPALLASGTYYVVQEGAGVLVGAGGWTRAAPPGFSGASGVGHIRHVVTDAARTREGIGRRLISHVFRSAEDAGIERLDCLSTLTAVPFYAAMGFQSLGPVTVPLRPGIDFPAVRMQRLAGESRK